MMVLRALKTEGFRCLAALEFLPGEGINVIAGDNAQGKTSLLEAILFAATSKSHRTSTETELVRYGQAGFRIRAVGERNSRPVTLESTWWQGQKRFKVNGVPLGKISDILGKLPVVFFSPEDVALVRGTPALRRRFLDMEISQLEPAYLRALQQFRAALRQRNELLRQEKREAALLDAWDEQLVRHGVALAERRRVFAEELGRSAVTAYEAIANKEPITLGYVPDVAPDQDYARVLLQHRERDLRQRVTTRGPHRDDFDLTVSGKPARQFASQGQQRTAALALKLAELALVRGRIGEYPILMLDDVLSELDATRSRRLFEAIPEDVQCLVTTTDMTAGAVSAKVSCASFLIRDGVLNPV